MPPQLVFIVSAPRSGSTMLERMLEAHSLIAGGPEPHLLTPLAHLGVWDNVDKAPYDHVLAAEAQKAFVQRLPGTENDYWAACRAYADRLYGGLLKDAPGHLVLDKTPAYALVTPFIEKIYPDARYVVLTRHPAAIFSSYANSFFNGDYTAANAHNPIIERYVPALAGILRRNQVSLIHVPYEDLVQNPESWTRKICGFLDLPFEPTMIDYGEAKREIPEGFGDPTGVHLHSRPSTGSIEKWTTELSADSAKRALMQTMIRNLDAEDLAIIGHPIDTLWAALDSQSPATRPAPSPSFSIYRLQRKTIIALRQFARTSPRFRKLLDRVRLTCDVLLRE